MKNFGNLLQQPSEVERAQAGLVGAEGWILPALRPQERSRQARIRPLSALAGGRAEQPDLFHLGG